MLQIKLFYFYFAIICQENFDFTVILLQSAVFEQTMWFERSIIGACLERILANFRHSL